MSADLVVERVDVHDDAALATWHDLVARADRHDHGDLATTWTLPELTAELRSGRRQVATAAYLGSVDGRAVAWGLTHLPQLDNTATADLGVAVPVHDALLERLALQAAARHEGYTVRTWTGPVPDELLDTWAVLIASLPSEAPNGDLHVEPEAADVEAVREDEQLLEAQGRTTYRAVALAPDGVAVGYTEVVTTVHERGRAYQWGTLVHGDHRGHRLGVALKVANQRALQAATDPAGPVTHVITWNADSNAHMVAVNESMGFEPVEWCAMLQKRL